MEYPIEIEYLKGSENTIADILSRLTGHAVDQMVPTYLASGIPTYACPVHDADRLELRTHWLNEQRADPTISRFAHHVVAKTKPSDDEIQLNPALQLYVEVWNSLVVENELLRHVNNNRHSSCVAVPPEPARGRRQCATPASPSWLREHSATYRPTVLVAARTRRRLHIRTKL